MLLYHGGGASDFEVLGPALTDEEWEKLRHAVIRLLRARKQNLAADLLEKVPFQLHQGTNYFSDEFTVLFHATSDVEKYTAFGEKVAHPDFAAAGVALAKTIGEVGPYVRFIEVRLDTNVSPSPVATPTLLTSSATVQRALDDAALLIRSNGAISAIDRAHTALHGYLRAACERIHLSLKGDETSAALFKQLRQHHPGMAIEGPRAEDIRKICNSFGAVLDALDPVRNRASVAHPNTDLLREEEAMLAINATRTILTYLNAKLG